MVQPRVLIVDEPEAQLALYRRLIGDLATITACSAAGDLDAALQADPAVIVLAATTPSGSYRELALRIRRHPGTRRTPLLLIGNPGIDPATQGISGPVDSLSVPVEGSALRAKVQLFADLQDSHRELAQLHERFLAIMSHELRTPLNAILGWTTLLRTGRIDPPTGERALETIERNARVQTHLIDELLDVSRIVAGKTLLERSEFDPSGLVDAALAAMAPAASSRRITLSGDYTGPAGSVHADFARLQQVIGQLLSNAIRCTPEGGPVRLHLDYRADALQITVADGGAGIDPELLPQLFDRFAQAEGSAGRRRSGRGLGLTIVRRLVELHGGTVTVDSPGDGQGATFTVSVPTGLSPPPAQRS